MPTIHRERRILPHATPAWVADQSIYFVTVCCQPRGANQLCHQPTAAKIFETISFRQDRGDWFVHLLVLMPDHLHLLVSFPRDQALHRVVTHWKSLLARAAGVRWQRDFFDHRLRSTESYEEKAHYIRQNPVRARLVAAADAWRYIWEPFPADRAGPPYLLNKIPAAPPADGGPGSPALPLPLLPC